MKKLFTIAIMFLFAIIILTGCKGKAKLADKPIVTFEFEEMKFSTEDPSAAPTFSDFGKVSFQLYTADAKKAVELFMASVKAGYYNAKVEGENNERFRYSLNEADHVYFMRLKYKLIQKTEANKKWYEPADVMKDTLSWSETIAPASNIDIIRGTLCLNSQKKGDLIIFKAKLAETGKFIAIGQVTADSLENLNKLADIETGIGETERTPQGQVVTSNPVNRFIFIKSVTITE